MTNPGLATLAAAASVLGIAMHQLYFIRNEHHLNGPRIALSAILLPITLHFTLVRFAGLSYFQATAITTAIWWSFVVSLWASMLIYRAFFHRLRSFPGPFGARLTKFWHSTKAANFRNFENVDQLHKRYGDYVRTGPEEISISDPAAIDLVHGPGSKCSKSMWYDLAVPLHTLQLCRDKAVHDKRRRTAWDRAFNSKALRSYDSRVLRYADELSTQIAAKKGQPINASVWFNYYTADTLFDLAFGKSFDMVKEQKGHWFLDMIKEGSQHLATIGPVPWMFQILGSIPMLMAADIRARDWCNEQLEERKKVEMKEPDIMSWLLDPLEPMSDDPKLNELWLQGDTRLVIIAGTDTTSAALTYIAYHLCRDPTTADKIRVELNEHGIDKDFSVLGLQACSYLNAFIDETMRLHPPVPSGTYRKSPPEGLKVGDTFIPGDVTIAMPTWTIQRSPKCFAEPDSFIPERWTTRPDLIINKKGYMPFDVGPYSCVGKQLALAELRTVIAKLVLEFDLAFAPDEDGSNLLEKTKDYFVLGLADFNVVFTPRK